MTSRYRIRWVHHSFTLEFNKYLWIPPLGKFITTFFASPGYNSFFVRKSFSEQGVFG